MTQQKSLTAATVTETAQDAAAATIKYLADLSMRAYTALMQGDAASYAAVMKHTADFTLMQPFGGKVAHGFDTSPGHLKTLGAFFRNGDFRQEIVQSIVSDDVAVLVTIEHQAIEVGDLAQQDWPLRVTLVFSREHGEWRLAHRHADPLVHGISVEAAALIARGDKGSENAATP
jgi:ketosteroid isomerase-like protein